MPLLLLPSVWPLFSSLSYQALNSKNPCLCQFSSTSFFRPHARLCHTCSRLVYFCSRGFQGKKRKKVKKDVFIFYSATLSLNSWMIQFLWIEFTCVEHTGSPYKEKFPGGIEAFIFCEGALRLTLSLSSAGRDRLFWHILFLFWGQRRWQVGWPPPTGNICFINKNVLVIVLSLCDNYSLYTSITIKVRSLDVPIGERVSF